MIKTTLAVLAVAFVAAVASANNTGTTTIQVANWVPPNNGRGFVPKDGAIVGDTISFSWPSGTNTNVYLQSGTGCGLDGATFVGPTFASDTSTSYTFTEEDGTSTGKHVVFASHVDENCFLGQLIRVTVYSTAEDYAAILAATPAPVEEKEDDEEEEEDATEDSSATRLMMSALSMTAGGLAVVATALQL